MMVDRMPVAVHVSHGLVYDEDDERPATADAPRQKWNRELSYRGMAVVMTFSLTDLSDGFMTGSVNESTPER